MRSRKVLAIGVLLVWVVITICLAYVFSDTGVVAQGDTEQADGVSPATEVGGIIRKNTTWTQENSPYILTSDVQIAPGITLTIKPGVVVSSGGRDYLRIVAFGTLLVTGKSNSEVVLNLLSISNATLSEDDPPSRVDIQYAHLNGVDIHVGAGGSLYLRDSLDQSQPLNYTGLVLTSAFDSYIERNVFLDGVDIYIQEPIIGHHVFMRNNVFQRTYGVSIDSLSDSTQVYIGNNVFADPADYAIESSSAVTVLVEYNSFFSDHKGIRLNRGYLDARNNYWNTTDPDAIAGMIYDGNDSLLIRDTVPFEPFLMEPDSNTPLYLPDQILLPSIIR